MHCRSVNINSLPPELLEEIFSYTVSHSDEVTITFLSYRSPQSPYSISHVCARWRSIALNLPHLWSHLFIINPANNDIGNLVWKWIDRAGILPLYLSVRGDTSNPNTMRAGALAVLKAYLASITRCRSFEMHLHDLPFPGYFGTPDIRPQHLSLLENIKVTCFDPSYLKPLLRAPNLRSATWIGQEYLLLEDLYLAWVSLRELTLGSAPAFPPLIRAISCCQRLERLTLSRLTYFAQDATPITLPQLTYLHIPLQPQILDCLIAPSLNELEVLATYDAQWRHMATFIERSAATLGVLKVHELDHNVGNFNEEQLLDVLKLPCFHNLQELEFTVPTTLYTIVLLTLPIPTLQTECDLTIPSNDPDPNLASGGHLQNLVRLSLTLSRKCQSSASKNLSRLVVSRGGSFKGRAMADFCKGWKTKYGSDEVTFRGNAQITFRWYEMSLGWEGRNLH